MNNWQEELPTMILNYLQKNPDAGDTLEGITKWWIGLEKIDLTVEEVVNALGNLMKKGLVRIHRAKDGLTLYKVNKKSY